MKSDDWIKQFEGINTLRRLLQFHVSNLNSSAMFSLHSVILDLLKHIESLRSNVSKNALITLTEMSQILKKQLDADAEAIILKLIKKGNDSNSFIAEEVKKALITIAQNCTDAKVIPIYQGLNNQKSIPAKMNVAISLEAIIQRNEDKINQIRDFDKLVVMLGNFLLDGAVEVRNVAKRATSLLLKYLYGRSEMDKILARNFNEMNLGKIYTIIDKELSQNSNPMVVTNSPQTANPSKSRTLNKSTKGGSKSTLEEEKHDNQEVVVSYKEIPSNSPPRGTKSSKLNLTKEPAEFEILPSLFSMVESSGIFQ
jgi:CLASP N terminal